MTLTTRISRWRSSKRLLENLLDRITEEAEHIRG